MATLNVTARLVSGDTLIAGSMSLVQLGTDPLGFATFDPFTLRAGVVANLPIGRRARRRLLTGEPD